MSAIGVKVPVGGRGRMSILPLLAIGLAISVVVILISRAWEGWKVWKEWRSTATETAGNMDDKSVHSAD